MTLNANALTTTSMAKTYLKILPLSDTSQDALVELLINASSTYLQAECDRSFVAQSVTEKRHGRSSNLILLKEWPVNTITELRIDSAAIFTDPATLIDPTAYQIADDGNSVLLLAQKFPKGYNNVRVIYNAGYAAIPSDLEHACLWLCTWYYRMRESQDIGRKSRSKGDETTEMLQSAPQEVRDCIRRYKRTEFPGSDASVQNT